MAVEKKKRRRRREAIAEPVSSKPKPSQATVDRRGLWVITSGRMKQYGDFVIERPGQIIRQQYLKNDELLLKHSYVRPLQDEEELTQCSVCGLMFLGSVTTGPYKSHLAYARHDLAKVNLDAGTATKDGKRARTGDIAEDPDSGAGGEWDLEPDGAPGERKLEEESPHGVRVSIGRR